MVLASYPGFFTTSPPSGASVYGIYWPCMIPAEVPRHTVTAGGETIAIPATSVSIEDFPEIVDEDIDRPTFPAPPSGPKTRAPLGRVVGARSGDKGGNANVGVWAKTDEAYAWLDRFLTVDRFKELISEAEDLEVERHDLPNLRSLNFVVKGWLGRGVAACTRLDTQAKGFGEYLRAKHVEVPDVLLD